METITRKGYNGWESKTEVPLEGKQVLRLTTYRNSEHGILFTRASVGTRDGDFITYALFSDFSEVVAKEPCARATAKVVEAQHQKVLADLDDLKARIAAYYASKDAVANG